jgi:hypothetical protein
VQGPGGGSLCEEGGPRTPKRKPNSAGPKGSGKRGKKGVIASISGWFYKNPFYKKKKGKKARATRMEKS